MDFQQIDKLLPQKILGFGYAYNLCTEAGGLLVPSQTEIHSDTTWEKIKTKNVEWFS